MSWPTITTEDGIAVALIAEEARMLANRTSVNSVVPVLRNPPWVGWHREVRGVSWPFPDAGRRGAGGG